MVPLATLLMDSLEDRYKFDVCYSASTLVVCLSREITGNKPLSRVHAVVQTKTIYC